MIYEVFLKSLIARKSKSRSTNPENFSSTRVVAYLCIDNIEIIFDGKLIVEHLISFVSSLIKMKSKTIVKLDAIGLINLAKCAEVIC